MPVMDTGASTLPDDVEALKALLSAALERADEAEARLANAMVRESATEAMIAHLKLQIARLRRSNMALAPSAAVGFSTSLSFSWKTSRPMPARMTWPPKSRRCCLRAQATKPQAVPRTSPA
jgi:hypothetical protein